MYLHFGPVMETVARADLSTAGIFTFWPPESSRPDCAVRQKLRSMPVIDVSGLELGASARKLQKLHGIPFAMHQVGMVAESVYVSEAAGLANADAGERGLHAMADMNTREKPWQTHPFGKMLMAYTVVQINRGIETPEALLNDSSVFNVTCGFGQMQSPTAFMALVAATAYLVTNDDYRNNPGQLTKFMLDHAFETDRGPGFLETHADANDNYAAISNNETMFRGAAMAMHRQIMPVILPKWRAWDNAMRQANGLQPMLSGRDLKEEVLAKAHKVHLGQGHLGMVPTRRMAARPEYERWHGTTPPCYRRTWTEIGPDGQVVEVWAPRLGD